MHKLIKLIVYAEDENYAVKKANSILENMCSSGRTYDWFSLFDEESKNTTAGIGRWGEFPRVTFANSKIGKELIDEGWNATKEEMKEALMKLREKIKNMKNTDIEKFIKTSYDVELNNLAYKVSDYDAVAYLYDNDGEAIRDEEHLNNALNKWNDSRYVNLKVYVVPADIHY